MLALKNLPTARGAKYPQKSSDSGNFELDRVADPSAPAYGYGSMLMKDVLAQCDREKKLAYLESSNPRNLSLYIRHGFELIGTKRPTRRRCFRCCADQGRNLATDLGVRFGNRMVGNVWAK